MNPIPKVEYIEHRLNRAQETFAEARMLFEGNHLTGTVNRMYYALFYLYNLAYDNRTTGDYADFPTFEPEKIASLLENAYDFIAMLTDLIFPGQSEENLPPVE